MMSSVVAFSGRRWVFVARSVVLLFALVSGFGCGRFGYDSRGATDADADARGADATGANDADGATETAVFDAGDGADACSGDGCSPACPAGQHACGATCASDTDPATCGAACTPCSVPANAVATCSASGGCGYTCSPGFHDCGSGVCASDTDATRCGPSCMLCPVPTNSVAACTGGVCGSMCSAGFHVCLGICVSDADPLTCGTSCTPCGAAPANATITCSAAGTCGHACNAGFHDCAGVCAADTDPRLCGAACTACTARANATATCLAGVCSDACNAGFHDCGGACVSNSDVATCGTAGCATCPAAANAVASCNGVVCGFTCNVGFADCDTNPTNGCEANLALPATCGSCTLACSGAAPLCQIVGTTASCIASCVSPAPLACGTSCVDPTTDPLNCGACGMICPSVANATPTCTASVCGFACSAGFHRCAGACVSDADPLTCGASCTACAPAPANATATCTAGVCGFACNAGFHLCSGVCVADSSPATCGTSCTACPVPASNGASTCDGVSCGISCNAGYHACGSSCALNTDPATCGASCTPCGLPPANSTVTCDGTACGFVCNAGFHLCSGACLSDTSVNSCGTLCTACPVPTNGSATCTAGACGIACNAGLAPYMGQCIATPVPPQQIAPLSTTTISSLNPTFRWILAPMTDGALLQICNDPACTTIFTSQMFTAGATSGTITTPLSRTPSYIYYWRVAGMVGATAGTVFSPAFRITINYGTGTANSSWGSHLDLDRDGFADMAVGAPAAATTTLFHGSATGSTSAPWLTLSGVAGSGFGTSVSSAGDANGNGFPELIVGAPAVNSAYVYVGSATGVSATATRTLSGPSGSGFGTSVSTAGDVNGDGYADVIVGAPTANAAYVYLGSATGIAGTPATTLTRAGGAFGQTVASAGDVDADGFGDVVVGAPGAGVVLFYRGSTGGLATTATTTLTGSAGSNFGISLSGPCDTIGTASMPADGYTDFVIGSPSTGQAMVYAGSATGLTVTPTTTLAPVRSGACPTTLPTNFGIAVDCSSDIDGNGYADVHVGSDGGFVYEFLSNNSGPGGRAGWSGCFFAPAGATQFGYSLHGTGPIDGNQFGEIYVGAPGSSAGYLFLGASAGLNGTTTAPTVTMTGAAGSGFGRAVY